METAEQKEFVAWFKAKYPAHEKSLRVSLRGLNFGSGQRAAKMVNHIKSQGSIAGESDIAILLPKGGYGSLLIEHKGAGQAHKVSEAQLDYLSYHRGIGNKSVTTRGLGELCDVVDHYMGL